MSSTLVRFCLLSAICRLTASTNGPETVEPTKTPIANVPTQHPTTEPTESPTREPTDNPTREPTDNPTREPTTQHPTVNPTTCYIPTASPTLHPTRNPAREPTPDPTPEPTHNPTREPTADQTVIIDAGSGYIRAGYISNHAPNVKFASVVGRMFASSIIYVGDEAKENSDILNLNLSYPIYQRYITNFTDMRYLWVHVYGQNQLNTNIWDHAVLLTEPPLNSDEDREELTTIMFEEFNVPKMILAPMAELALYSTGGSTTGIVIYIDWDVTFIVPIYRNNAISSGVISLGIGKLDLIEYLQQLLAERNCYFTTAADKDIVQDMLEKWGYVALDYDAELAEAEASSDIEIDYETSNGQIITIESERFKAPEALFQTSLLDSNSFNILDDPEGISGWVYESIHKVDVDIRKDLYSNIVVAGEGSMFTGIADRIKADIEEMEGVGYTFNVIANADREYAAWVGGKIIAELSTFDQYWITKDEYNTYGASIVNDESKAWPLI